MYFRNPRNTVAWRATGELRSSARFWFKAGTIANRCAGRGNAAPELAGRDAVLADPRLAIQRNKSGRSARSFMFVGSRGVGKTVLMKLDCIKGVSGRVKKSLRVLKRFVGALKVAVEGVEFAVDDDGEPGEAVGRTEFRPGDSG